MKRAIALTVPLFVFAAILGLVLIRERGFPDNARTTLDQYLTYRQRVEARAWRVQSIVRARRPWNFTPEMSALTLGDSARYRTALDLSGQPREAPIPVTTTDVLANRNYQPEMPLPFPPQEVWCARLEASGHAPAAVFVALHQDLYNGAWIIHEPASGVDQTLSAIGCE
jgi:hypothetical protein